MRYIYYIAIACYLILVFILYVKFSNENNRKTFLQKLTSSIFLALFIIAFLQLSVFTIFQIANKYQGGEAIYHFAFSEKNTLKAYESYIYTFLNYDAFIVLGLCLLVFTIEIIRKLKSQNEDKEETFYTFFKTLLRGVSITILLFIAIGSVIIFLDSSINYLLVKTQFTTQHFIWNFFDWVIIEKITTINFHKGFIFSFIVSVLISVFQFIYLIINNKQLGTFIKIEFLILSIIFGIGLFTSTYSLVNVFYNGLSFNDKKLWFESELSAGLLIYRFTSFVIFIALVGYIFKHVFNKKIRIGWIYIKTLRVDATRSVLRGFEKWEYSSVYFSQMAFYSIIFCIVYYCFRIEDHSWVTQLLNLGLFYIIDDWQIIFKYSFKLEKIHKNDNRKILFVNIGLLVLGIISIINNLPFYVLLIYLAIILFLAYIRFSNKTKLQEL